MDKLNIQHRDLNKSGRWASMSFYEQMANIGSEVSRSCKWKSKKKPELMSKALDRCLELLDMTIQCNNGTRLKELLRIREVICDYFVGNNEFNSTPAQLQKYFDDFAFVIRK